MKKKKKIDWNFALPEDKEKFVAMSDILYTHLFSISKHNPKPVYNDETGEYTEERYNYIYLDKNPKTGKKDYRAEDTWKALGMTKSTYYNKYNKLKELHLIQEDTYYGRKILKIPFIRSNKLVDVRTCKFLTEYYNNVTRDECPVVPNDIIKLLAILKIIYFSKNKTFTIGRLKGNLGYSDHKEKDDHVLFLLNLLRSFKLIDFEGQIIEREGAGDIVKFDLLWVNDNYNDNMYICEFIKNRSKGIKPSEKEYPVE